MGEIEYTPHSVKCPAGCRTPYVRRGHYFREDDRKLIQRYLCRGCGRSFSEATHDPCFKQKKRRLNRFIFLQLTGLHSQRRIALDLEITRETVIRKFLFLAHHAKAISEAIAPFKPKMHTVEFDDLESSIHTKCKPVSVCIAVTAKERWILGYTVATMPAKGRLASISRKKYGKRADERREKREALFTELRELVPEDALFKSDRNPDYPALLKRHFPQATHKTYKGRRSRHFGQGELKEGHYDPIFSINHTCAMLRANINRLIRQSWCTSKRQDRLDLHIGLYVFRHNLQLIQKKDRPHSLFTQAF